MHSWPPHALVLVVDVRLRSSVVRVEEVGVVTVEPLETTLSAEECDFVLVRNVNKQAGTSPLSLAGAPLL